MQEKEEIFQLSSECFENIERAESITALLIERYNDEKLTSIPLEMVLSCIRNIGDRVVKIHDLSFYDKTIN